MDPSMSPLMFTVCYTLPTMQKSFGSLDNFSAFKFVNFMKTLKRTLCKAEKPLEQISNRYEEIRFSDITSNNENVLNIGVKNLHDKGPLIGECCNPQFSKVVFPNYSLSIKPPDNCCFINEDIVCLQNIATTSTDKYMVISRKFEIIDKLYNYPCSSTDLGIFKVRKLSALKV